MFRLAPTLLLTLGAAGAVSGCATSSSRPATPTTTTTTTLPASDHLQVRQGVKAVYGVGKNAMRQGVGEGLFFAKRLVSAWDKEGIERQDRVLVVAVYDEAAEWVLNEGAWARTHPAAEGAAASTNHSAGIVSELIAAGVSVEVCGMTMKKNGWTAADLLPGVVVVPGAYSRIVDLQLQGFATVSFF
jgi:intracellular sulfur oxidation DsrE/DsrF family protein